MSSILRVLTYHRIAEFDEHWVHNPRLISATPEVFAGQMQHLATHYEVISVHDVLKATQKQIRLPKRAVLLTFDDGYRDFAEIAWPILKEFHFPAILFVPTAFPNQAHRLFWWDQLYQILTRSLEPRLYYSPVGWLSLQTPGQRLRSVRKIQNYLKTMPHREITQALEELRGRLGTTTVVSDNGVLSWDELRCLSAGGVTIAPHTQTHILMTELAPEQIRAEIDGARRDLKRELGLSLPVWCYPYGAYNQTVVEILKEEEFALAFTNLDGKNDLNRHNLLCLRRTNITPRTSLPIFRLRMIDMFTFLDMWRHGAHAGT